MKIKLKLTLFGIVFMLSSLSAVGVAFNGTLKLSQGIESVSYYANHSLDEVGDNFTRAVIVVHGVDRNALEYYQTIATIAQNEGEYNNTLIIAPHFKIDTDEASANELQWLSPGGWKSGSKSATKAGLSRVSSFTVMDELIEHLMNKGLFTNLKEIVLTGHSAGGQYTHRYSATTQLAIDKEKFSLRYVIANPATYMYLDAKRPTVNGFQELSSEAIATCPRFNNYKYGLNNPYSYLSSLSAEEIKTQYFNREVIYLLGTEDTAITALSTSGCEAELQGLNRYERGLNYWNYINTFPTSNNHLLFKVEGVGHTRTGIYSSANGIKALFTTTTQTSKLSNYIKNSGAEEGIVGWTTFGGGAEIQSSTIKAHSGTHSFLSENRTQFYHGPSTNIKPLVDNTTLISGKRYTASVWVYHHEATAKKLYLNIKQVDGSGTSYNGLENELVPPNQWVKIVKHFILDVDSTLNGLDMYVVSASGETFDFYTDDFFLGELENYTPPSSSTANAFIKASGKNLLLGSSEINLKGINVTVPVDADDTAQDIWDVKSVSLKDFKNIKSLGFNAIRLHMNYKIFEDDSRIGEYKEDGWHWLDRAIAYAKEAGVYLLLDMHAGQGGYQSDKSKGFSAFWDGVGTAPYTSNQERLLNLWGAIATRYKHETTILGYDLLNEPRPNDSEEWLSYAEQLIAKIRTKDNNHLIVLEVPFISGYTMRTVSDSNVMYDSHTYAIWEYSIQYSAHYGTEGQRWGAYSNTNPLYVNGSWNVVWQPKDGGTPPANSTAYNKDFLEAILVDDILEFANNNNVPVNVGEFGSVVETFQNDVGALELTKDTYSIFSGANRYGMKLNSFYFTYQSGVFGLYGNWQGFQVDEANVNKVLKGLFLGGVDTNDSTNDNIDNGDGTNDEDTILPVITLIGESTVTINVGESYSDEGAIANDDVDGNITADILTLNEVDINVANTYVITYNVRDSSANNAIQVTRTVIVNENNPVVEVDETDLKLEFTWGNYPSVPVIGRAHKFVAKIYNISEVASLETKLNIQLPAGATLHKGRGCQLNDDEISITCDVGKISGNRRRTRSIYLLLSEGGNVEVNAKVLSATNESRKDNNTGRVNINVSEDSDLSVTVRKVGKARIGQALGIKVRTKNKGPAFAKEVTTVFAIPENADFISTSSTACTFKADWDEVYCEWDILNNRERRTVYIYIRPLEGTLISLESETDSDNNDPILENNFFSKTINIR